MGDELDGTAGFAAQAMDAVTSGRINIHPARYAKSYLDWLGEKRDWCISRQLWWGHRIPIWHCGTCTERDLEKAFAGRRDVVWRAGETGGWLLCGETDFRGDELGSEHLLTQDPDVLDTWFSSALWPHSTLGWPEETAELNKFYPTSVLSTARDIITLWVARMVIFGLFNRGDVPFRDVYIHPIIQDGKGRRMAKMAGNGVDPVDIIEIHGADALHYTLASSATETQDLRIPVEPLKLPDGRVINTSERFEQGRNFANKFWNAARLTLMNLEGYEPAAIDLHSLADRGSLDSRPVGLHGRGSDPPISSSSSSPRRFAGSATSPGAISAIGISNSSRAGSATKIETRRSAHACGCARLTLPSASSHRAVCDRAGMARLERTGTGARLLAARPASESVCIAPWPRPVGFRDETARRNSGPLV